MTTMTKLTDPTRVPRPWASNALASYDENADSDDLHELTLREAYVAGTYRIHRSCHVVSVAEEAPLVPAGAQVARESVSQWFRSVAFVGAGFTGRAARHSAGSLHASVYAVDAATAEAVLAHFTALLVEPTPDPTHVDITFTYGARSGAARNVRRIEVPDWHEVRRNYPGPVRRQCEAVLQLDPTDAPRGRLVLLHGPPGTGKTTLVRAIASTWRAWCDTELIVDPERLLNDPAYLFATVLGDGTDEDTEGDPRWRLFVLEDCDELLRADAKQASGQAMSRLLNIADGVLGQGRRVLILLSTNERLDRLHPAVRRPGRCLAEIEVRAFTRAEAAAWLGPDLRPPADGASLAELYALRDGTLVEPEPDRPAVGMYL